MPFLVARPGDRWELRESHTTPNGPRSRTLATFRELDAATAEQAAERSSLPTSAKEIRALCRRAGAPVAPLPADRAAATLLRELSEERRPSSGLEQALKKALAGQEPSDAELAAAQWAGRSAKERGLALHELLLLADRIPAKGRGELAFPPLRSASG
ncbi:MAG: hypothetical protein M3355_06865 [Actinomycetota bacterium]|nr:hypothetical protein [Actinomycetota bacterium]